MKQKDIQPCSDGFTVTYVPAKQTGHTITKEAIIPRNKEQSQNGKICLASILESYLVDLRKDLHQKTPPLTEDSPLFFTGRKPTAKGTSIYVNSPLGENELKGIGKYIARILGYPDADDYTGNYLFFQFFFVLITHF